MSDTVSGFHSAHFIENGLKRVTKNSLVAQSNRFFLVSFPLELWTVVDTDDQCLFLTHSFLAALYLSRVTLF